MNLITFIVLSLAVYRLSKLMAEEDGPFNSIDKLRYVVGVRTNDDGEIYGKNSVATGVICTWCNSIWIGLAITVAWFFTPYLVMLLCLPFALSAVTVVLDND